MQWANFRGLGEYALKIQRCFQGHKVRLGVPKVLTHMRIMYEHREREAMSALAVRMQSGARRFLAVKRCQTQLELKRRRDRNEADAITVMQALARQFVYRLRYIRFATLQAATDDTINNAAGRIQAWWNANMGVFRSKMSRQEQEIVRKRRKQKATKLQAFYRGHIGRQRTRRRRIRAATEFYAATMIQKVYRCSRIMYWRDMRINIIAVRAAAAAASAFLVLILIDREIIIVLAP